MINKDIVYQHLAELGKIITQLGKYTKLSFNEFKTDLSTIWAVEHGLQLAIQNVIDISAHILSSLNENSIDNYSEILQKLGEKNVIPQNFAKKIIGMAGFRNLLVHEYIKVDIKKVYSILTNNLSDFNQFLDYINKYLK